MSFLFWVFVFAVATYAIWHAGILLVDATNIIDEQLNLGEALGGTILLAIATNLPEIAIMVSAALKGTTNVITGNLLGGVAIQTVLLALFDFRLKGEIPLTRRAASPALMLEGLLVIAVLSVCIMGTQLPTPLIFERVTPEPFLITGLWLVGLWLVGWASRSCLWHDGADGEVSMPMTASARPQNITSAGEKSGWSLSRACWTFSAAALLTLVAGVTLEWAGEAIAAHLEMGGALFGATFLAAATSLPEISTGLRAVRKGGYQLAVSDIFGGNAFLPVLFLPSTLIAGRAVLPLAQETDIYLTGLAILLTCIYLVGLIVRPKRKVLGLGADSAAVLIFYVAGMVGLFAISGMR
jgi:cation:H+ antiporter